MANWKMAKAKTATGATSSSIGFYFKEALKHFQDAKEHGKGRDYAWHDAHVIASLGCWSGFCDQLNEWEHRDDVREREKLVSYIIDDATKVSPDAEWAELEKLYQKAVIHYHPDRVDEEEHGAKWKVLTEEITKLLTRIYEIYEGQ